MKPWLQLVFFACTFLIWRTEAEFFTSIGMERTNAWCSDVVNGIAKTVKVYS